MLIKGEPVFEQKFARFGNDLALEDDARIEGYASLFNVADEGGDIVQPGAYSASLARHAARGTAVKMLWQHQPDQPIGVWDRVLEDERGLKVTGRLLTETRQGAEAAALVKAGAIEGLSIGYRTVKASRDSQGRRLLTEVSLFEVSLVTFPMLPTARVAAKAEATADPAAPLRALVAELRAACRS
ncbi:phage prohead protease, HK97 family [Tritonibacter multivorans]|uniref:Phage prohead protease, HK97 family n=1 Tax=Tritonibacter multivorans TaxID=928856 RepID=A0A0P1GZB8_9RHOB|nr:HK97 family phage prohead protease [Tritonibacter multivorans]MDA7420431.1 HK97 family phage prohead protease [Tritonibacter multivorans]CUH81621.1 phage prohead protease, HK97 family [Tritonibacter multivorans]SFC39432.1 hypothetical protein SAMN04488049_102351 [Tritonibacter multivorans]